MTKETAVQEFNWWVNNHINDLLDGTLGYEEFKQRMEATYLEFKEMEKEQIENAYFEGVDACDLELQGDRYLLVKPCSLSGGALYYNENYEQ